MSTPENEMDAFGKKTNVKTDKMHHMTSKKINRQVTPDTVVYPDDILYKKPNTEIPINPPKDNQ